MTRQLTKKDVWKLQHARSLKSKTHKDDNDVNWRNKKNYIYKQALSLLGSKPTVIKNDSKINLANDNIKNSGVSFEMRESWRFQENICWP